MNSVWDAQYNAEEAIEYSLIQIKNRLYMYISSAKIKKTTMW